jgi:hypothetical protein
VPPPLVGMILLPTSVDVKTEASAVSVISVASVTADKVIPAAGSLLPLSFTLIISPLDRVSAAWLFQLFHSQ